MPRGPRLELAAWALVCAQILHVVTPVGSEGESWAGPIGGLALLIASLAAVYGLRTGADWAKRLTGVTGLALAIGFTAYHATPWHSPLTNPYFGEPVGVPGWISVLLAVAAGIWAAIEGFRDPDLDAPAPAARA